MGHHPEQTLEPVSEYLHMRDAQLIAEAVAEHLGPQTEWAPWPGGYGDRVDLALIDAVMSIRLSYGRERREGTYSGVNDAIWRYRVEAAHVSGRWLEHLASHTPEELASTLHSRQVLRGGNPKAQAIIDAAKKLVDAGLGTRAAVLSDAVRARSAYASVRGLDLVTFDYFTMLLGADEMTSDSRVVHFASRAAGRSLQSDEAAAALRLAAEILCCPVSFLDHAVWSFATTSGLDAMARVVGE